MKRRTTNERGSWVAVVAVTSLVTAVVQQVMFARFLASTRREFARCDHTVADRSGRWAGSAGVSPVSPQHPHAATGVGTRRARIV